MSIQPTQAKSRSRTCLLLLVFETYLAAGVDTNYTIDLSKRGRDFRGLGVNPSAGTYRLLFDYPEPQRSEILDYMFKPGFGASYHRCKVEIGGDGQGTDGSEPSHMRSPHESNFDRGCAYWIMREAKKRNPDLELWGLAESWPRWVNNATQRPQDPGPFVHIDLAASYIVEWVRGAKVAHNLTIDWVGLWNEHWEGDPEFAYVLVLRKALDEAGFQNTKIIGPDSMGPAVDALAAKVIADPEMASAIGALGVHGCFSPLRDCMGRNSLLPKNSLAYKTGLPLFNSEDGSTYGDAAGALSRVRETQREMIDDRAQGTNFWNPFYGHYPNLPFAGHSLMDCHRPWSGHYLVRTPVWAAAHMCQHTKIGWSFLQLGYGTGNLSGSCGSMISYLSPDGVDLTIVLEKADMIVDTDRVMCVNGLDGYCPCEAEDAVFTLVGGVKNITSLNMFLSQVASDGTPIREFERQSEIAIVNGSFLLHIPVNSIITLTTRSDGGKGQHPVPPPPSAFPVPYHDTFDSVMAPPWLPKYFSDMSGAFEVKDGTLHQVVPGRPLGWFGIDSDYVPYTIIGAADWADYRVAADIRLGPWSSQAPTLGWVGARLGGNSECDSVHPICSTPWGLFLSLAQSETEDQGLEVRLHARLSQIADKSTELWHALLPLADGMAWNRLDLEIRGTQATIRINNTVLASSVDVMALGSCPGRGYTSCTPRAGWAGLGGGASLQTWSTSIEFDNFTVLPLEANATSISLCRETPQPGMLVRGVPCGLDVPGLAWDMDVAPGGSGLQRFRLRADNSLCITAAPANALTLDRCSKGADAQQDFNYTHNSGIILHPASSLLFCLPEDDAFNRGTVRPWEPALLQPTNGLCSPSSPNGGADVALDVELGYIRAFADTTAICFGVCFSEPAQQEQIVI